MTFPQYYRTVDEFAAPLRDPAGPVAAAGLRLETIETGVTPCPYAAAARDGGDPTAFAEPMCRPCVPGRIDLFQRLVGTPPEAERRQVIEDFYQAYVDRVAADPRGHAMDYVHAYMTIAKGREAPALRSTA